MQQLHNHSGSRNSYLFNVYGQQLFGHKRLYGHEQTRIWTAATQVQTTASLAGVTAIRAKTITFCKSNSHLDINKQPGISIHFGKKYQGSMTNNTAVSAWTISHTGRSRMATQARATQCKEQTADQAIDRTKHPLGLLTIITRKPQSCKISPPVAWDICSI